MQLQDNNTETKAIERRYFVAKITLLTGFFAFLSLTGFSIFKKWSAASSKPVAENGPIRMLSHDGRLVEVSPEALHGSGRVVSNIELQKWIKR
jgi:hypothetical protein